MPPSVHHEIAISNILFSLGCDWICCDGADMLKIEHFCRTCKLRLCVLVAALASISVHRESVAMLMIKDCHHIV